MEGDQGIPRLGRRCHQELTAAQRRGRPRAFTEILIYHLWYGNLFGVVWGSVELEPEVVEWLESLPDDQFGRVEFYIDLLADRGAQLGEPYTRQLQGKLRELRFYLGPQSDAVRVTYYIATGRRIILLTVFRKQRQRERAEIDRAVRAMEKCIAEGHTVEDEHD